MTALYPLAAALVCASYLAVMCWLDARGWRDLARKQDAQLQRHIRDMRREP